MPFAAAMQKAGHLLILAMLAAVPAIVVTWLAHRPPRDVVPVEYRGYWSDVGADCHDAAAQARIASTTIDYDVLAFRADSPATTRGDVTLLAGTSYPDGRADHETVALRLAEHRSQLFISAPDLGRKGPLVRCHEEDEE